MRTIIKKGFKSNGLVVIEDCINMKVKIRCHCGKTKWVYPTELKRGVLKSCGCKSIGYKTNKTRKTDPDYPYKIILTDLIHKRKDSYEIYITFNDIKQKWIEQSGKCIYTGQQLNLSKSHCQNYKDKFAPSVDRIDSSKPYQFDNIQFVDKRINFMKHLMSHDKFLEMCKLIADNNPI